MSKDKTRISKYRKTRKVIENMDDEDFDTLDTLSDGHHVGDIEPISTDESERVSKLGETSVSISYDELVEGYQKYADEQGIENNDRSEYDHLLRKRRIIFWSLIALGVAIAVAIIVVGVFVFGGVK